MTPNAAQLALLQAAAEGALIEQYVVRAGEPEYGLFKQCLAAGWITLDHASFRYDLTRAGLLALKAGCTR